MIPGAKETKVTQGVRYWYYMGPGKGRQLHNANGPAIIGPNGEKQWFLKGESVTEAQWNNRRQKEPGYKPDRPTPPDRPNNPGRP